LGWNGERLARVSESFLRIVAIATVADVTPLAGENRIIVKRGLADLRAARNPGLRALMDVAGIAGQSSVTARQVAFQLAPRLNAAGRMDTAEHVVELLLTSDAARARGLAAGLHAQNAERQRIENDIREACERVQTDPAAAALVYYNPEWHRGVLGIVASRMVERRRRPVFVLGLNPEDGLAQGSGRGIPAFHLLDALDSMSGLFARYGGHRYAAGVSLDPARIAEFRARLNAFARSHLSDDDFAPRLEIDAVVELSEIDEAAVRSIEVLAPFGYGNPQPLLAALDVEVAAPPVVFAQKHLRVAVKQNGRSLTLKAWNQAADAAAFTPGTRLDIAFTVEDDAYSAARGYQPWSASLKAARAAGPSGLPPAFGPAQ
jgi:single-stranded-DNA-specific exonuclease